jgi:hypothetical protein
MKTLLAMLRSLLNDGRPLGLTLVEDHFGVGRDAFKPEIGQIELVARRVSIGPDVKGISIVFRNHLRLDVQIELHFNTLECSTHEGVSPLLLEVFGSTSFVNSRSVKGGAISYHSETGRRKIAFIFSPLSKKSVVLSLLTVMIFDLSSALE